MIRILILSFILAASLCAQTFNKVTITIGTKTWSFDLPVGISALKCDKTALAAGDSSTCTLTLDSPAPAAGFAIAPYSADVPLVLAPATLTVPANAVTVQFTVTRP